MEKRSKNILLIISLALCAGLFVYFFMPAIMARRVDETSALEDEIINSKIDDDSNEKIEQEKLPQTVSWTKESLAEEISNTAGFKEDGTVLLSFSIPPNSDNFYISVQAEIFNDTGKSIGSYLSDEQSPNLKNHENEEAIIKYDMNVPSMKNKLGILAIRVFDAEKKELPVIYQLVVNFDGNKVWNNNLDQRGVQ